MTGRVLRRLLPYLRPHRARLALAALATVGVTSMAVARPWPIKVVIDQVILERPWNVLPAWLSGADAAGRLLFLSVAAIVLLAVLHALFSYTKALLLATAGQRIVARLREDLLDRLLRLSLGYHGAQRSGDLFVRMSGDTAMLRQLLAEGLFAFAQEIATVALVLGVMAWLDPQLALLAALVVPAVVLLMVVFGRRLRQAARKQRKKEGQIGAAISESLGAVAVIQAYSLEEKAKERFSKSNRKSLKAGLAAARLEAKMSGWAEVAMALGTAATLLAGVGKVRAGLLSPGELLVILSYVRALYKPLRKAVTRSSRLFKAAACGERVLDVLDRPIDLPPPARPVVLSRPRGEVEFAGVSFAYGEDRPVLVDVTLRIEAGERVALVGPNGAGKSTLASLVPRLRDATSGVVRLDGHDVRELDPASLRRAVGLVFQDTVLFDGSLRENILLGRPDASADEVVRAAELSGVARMARELPDGLDTQVGERGIALSGGQRQRIALARALVRDAAVLVFDEPTASLDDASERLFTRDLLDALRGKTLLVLTHSRELAAVMDRIVRLEAGRIVGVERGAGGFVPAAGGPARSVR